MKKTDFIKTEDEVKELLINIPSTRNDDMLLYALYVNDKIKDSPYKDCCFVACFVKPQIRKEYDIHPFETISRCRRKIQAKFPELESERTKRLRAKKEEAFKEYARL